MKKTSILLCIISLTLLSDLFSQQPKPVRIGIAGLTHGHVNGLLRVMDNEAFEIVGIAESNAELVDKLVNRFKFSRDLVYPSLEKMIQNTRPQAVAAFNSTYEHLEVVEICAPKGIHVMVEKPLAVNMEHASRMKKLVDKHKIMLITNYETTWYPTNHKAFDMVTEGKVGEIRKVVIHDGHAGPKEIGVGPEFFEWLVDPKLNGGGAITDFGCYGANLITWLMDGKKPLSVSSMTHTNKPEIYKVVDDEATIILQYPKAQVVIQASWNWPFSRKDMEVYGQTGTIFCDNHRELRYRFSAQAPEDKMILEPRPYPYDNPYTFLAAVVKGDIDVIPGDLSSLENNLVVVEILDAARKSASEGKVVYLE
ncbi:MAG: Gfo/Idh/MocA family oxidoreductase [Cyclobacteriaceae bacterium]